MIGLYYSDHFHCENLLMLAANIPFSHYSHTKESTTYMHVIMKSPMSNIHIYIYIHVHI